MITAAVAAAARSAFAVAVLSCFPASAWPQAPGSRTHGDAERGRAEYATYCAPCHGARGAGDGPLAEVLMPRPARHDDASYMDRLSDGYLMLLLKEGGPALGKSPLMGKWGRRLTHEQLLDIVAYIRTLRR